MFANSRRIKREASNRRDFQDSLLDAAFAYIACGWPVIPLLGKQPGLSAWKDFQTRLPTADEVATWFQGSAKIPTGVGIITGKLSGLVVVDCDSPEDASYWLECFPPSPLTVKTGRGGLHIYYQMPSSVEVRNRAKLFHRQIDLRGEGGYAAAPPSRHSNGQRYEWRDASPDLQLVLPQFNAEWLTDGDSLADVRAPAACSAQVRNVVAYLRRIHATAGDAGHNATFRAACKLRDSGLSAEDAFALLSQWNETNAHPPWSAVELKHKINSAYQVDGGREAGKAFSDG